MVSKMTEAFVRSEGWTRIGKSRNAPTGAHLLLGLSSCWLPDCPGHIPSYDYKHNIVNFMKYVYFFIV